MEPRERGLEGLRLAIDGGIGQLALRDFLTLSPATVAANWCDSSARLDFLPRAPGASVPANVASAEAAVPTRPAATSAPCFLMSFLTLLRTAFSFFE